VFSIGPHRIDSRVILAPMAGITDRPFRQLCRSLGAGLAVSEMLTSDAGLWSQRKSVLRRDHQGETDLIVVQIAGSEPDKMAEAAKLSADQGAQVIDINMGCPAKKVCKKAAGSALLKDENLVALILKTVVNAVDLPVTLKFRTGWSQENRNAIQIAKIAEDAGIQALALHGRTRADAFNGEAEYDTIAHVVKSVKIPVFANGDISTPQKAKQVLDFTGAAAVMIGRAAQGRPWIFREITGYLNTGEYVAEPSLTEVRNILNRHLQELYEFYGDHMGPRIARKHVGWYLQTVSHQDDFRKSFNAMTSAKEQLTSINHFFDYLLTKGEKTT
jgi:tRNA-dihydrouridine synthase B